MSLKKKIIGQYLWWIWSKNTNKILATWIQICKKDGTPWPSGVHPISQGWFNICKQSNVIYHINKRKVKNHIIFSIDAEKEFDKIQIHLWQKNLTKVGIEGTYLNIIKANLWQTHSQYNTQWRKAESLPAKIWNKIRMPTLAPFIQHSVGSHSHSHQTNKRNKKVSELEEKR